MNHLFEVHPHDAPLSAEIRGLDLRQPLPESTVHALRDVWHEHLVLLFRDQFLNDAQHFAFTSHFGDLEHTPQKLLELAHAGLKDSSAPEVTVISNIVENGAPIGRLGNSEALWHSDSNFVDEPPAASILRALEVPHSGGDTSFMNMYEALDSLPDSLRDAIEGRQSKHDPTFDSSGARRPQSAQAAHPAHGPGPVHPMVRTHQGSGRRALYLGRRSGAYVMGMDIRQSEILLDAIWAHITTAPLIWTHQWRIGDVLMWDNRCTMHRRDSFDGRFRRLMHRTQLAGGRPS